MKRKGLLKCLGILRAATIGFACSQTCQAQVFVNSNSGDLMLGFRKTGVYAEAFEVVVDTGRATNLVGLTPGTTISVSGYTNIPQLVTGSFSSFDNLTWSAFG